jgi:CDP-paratose 2-epimerase
VRDVLCVDDLVQAFEAARQLPASPEGRIYNIGGGPENTLSLLELVEMVEAMTGRKFDLHYDQPRPGDQLYYVSNFSKFQRDTGWKPTVSPAETLKRIHQFWKKNRDVFAIGTATPAVVPASSSELAQPA